jgi:hypothetical protein
MGQDNETRWEIEVESGLWFLSLECCCVKIARSEWVEEELTVIVCCRVILIDVIFKTFILIPCKKFPYECTIN